MKRILAILFCALLLFGCSGEVQYTASEDSFWIVVEPAIEEPLYEIVMDYGKDGEWIGVQGVTNADNSAMTDRTFGFLFDPDEYPEDVSIEEGEWEFDFWLRSTPGAPEMDPAKVYDGKASVQDTLKLSTEFGHVYYVRIEGSVEKGYTATYLGADLPQGEPQK